MHALVCMCVPERERERACVCVLCVCVLCVCEASCTARRMCYLHSNYMDPNWILCSCGVPNLPWKFTVVWLLQPQTYLSWNFRFKSKQLKFNIEEACLGLWAVLCISCLISSSSSFFLSLFVCLFQMAVIRLVKLSYIFFFFFFFFHFFILFFYFRRLWLDWSSC